MAIPRWEFRIDTTKAEEQVFRRVRKKRKLFAFLREYRHELFDEQFQEVLEQMYRDSGAGKKPVPPAQMAMVVLLQGYAGVSDSDAVEMAACDSRWQLVLDTLGEEPPFSQGALFAFRERLIKCDMDVRLLERTRELARRTGAFDWKKLPKELRVAIDSSPLIGAGRVEDAINLLAHAARSVVLSVAQREDKPVELLVDELGIPLLAESSIKKALDVDWNVEQERTRGLNLLLDQIEALERWIREHLGEEADKPPLKGHLQLLRELREQDLEPDPSGAGKRVRRGVAKDRRISVTDPDMRHGHKTKTKAFNGYKRHVAADLDTRLVIAVELTPANKPENEALGPLLDQFERQRLVLGEMHFDRGYVSSPRVVLQSRKGVTFFCKPWAQRNGRLYSKADFRFNRRTRTVTCPAGQTQPFVLGESIEFEPARCRRCKLRPKCTTRREDRGRSLHVANDEHLQLRFRRLVATKAGRSKLRQRVAIEHRLAHVGRRQGRRARYRGRRKNLYDLRRAAAIENLNIICHELEAQTSRIAA